MQANGSNILINGTNNTTFKEFIRHLEIVLDNLT